MFALQALRIRMRGPMVFLYPSLAAIAVLVVGVALRIRRMKHWSDAAPMGVAFGLVVASVITGFVVGEIRLREWFIAVVTWVGVLQSCFGFACLVAAIGLACTRRR